MSHRMGWCLFAFALLVLWCSHPAAGATFLPFTNYSTGLPAKAATFVSYSGSQRPDLAYVAYSSATGTVGTMRNNGTGAFAPRTEIAPLSRAAGIAVDDFNGDHLNDLAVIDKSDNSVHIFLGYGDHSFSPGAVYPIAATPSVIAAADFNRDGISDLAVVSSGAVTASLQILSGIGDGTFTVAPAAPLAAGSDPQAVVAADLNGDGVPDLAVTFMAGNMVSVLPGNGSGGFPARTDYPVGTAPAGLAAGDFNADGRLDLAVATSGVSTVAVLLNTGNGVLGTAVNYQAGTQPTGVTSGDFNRDGKPDLAVTLAGDASIGILAGRGDGSFLEPETFATGGAPGSPAAADLDGDGIVDLAVTSDSPALAVLVNDSLPAAGMTVSPTAFDFGGVTISMTIPGPTYDFTIANSGSADLVVTGMTLAGIDRTSFDLYPGGPDPCPSLAPTILPGNSCTVTAKFVPFSAGSKVATIDISSNALTLPNLPIQLNGAGEYPKQNLLVLLSGSPGSVTLSTGDSCGSNCQLQIQRYTNVLLTPVPAAESYFAGWSGCDSVAGGVCNVTIGDIDPWVTATFTTTLLPVRIPGGVPTYFNTITGAYATLQTGETMQVTSAGNYVESPVFGRTVAVNLAGGFDSSFGQTGGLSTIRGSLTIAAGTVTVDGIAIM